MSDRLMNGEKLGRGQSLTSRNGAYTLKLQDDGNLSVRVRRPGGRQIRRRTAAPPPAAQAPAPEVVPAAVQEPAPAAEPEPAPAPPPPPAPRTYTVVSGDTLWAISERFYGDGSKYQVIADASGISNPDLIYPGQVLTIP